MKILAVVATVLCVATVPASAVAGCGKHRSPPSTRLVDITFENKTGGTVNVVWYNFQGGSVKYQSLGPQQSYVQSTYVGHVWKFTDAKGKCRSTFVAKRSQTFVIR